MTRYFTRFFFFIALLFTQLGMSSFGFLEPAGLMKVARKTNVAVRDSTSLAIPTNSVAMVEEAKDRVKEQSKNTNSLWTSLLVQKVHFYMKSFVGKMCFVCVKCAHVVVMLVIESFIK